MKLVEKDLSEGAALGRFLRSIVVERRGRTAIAPLRGDGTSPFHGGRSQPCRGRNGGAHGGHFYRVSDPSLRGRPPTLHGPSKPPFNGALLSLVKRRMDIKSSCEGHFLWRAIDGNPITVEMEFSSNMGDNRVALSAVLSSYN